MKYFILFLITIIILSCNSKEQNLDGKIIKTITNNIEKNKIKSPSLEYLEKHKKLIDSLEGAWIDINYKEAIKKAKTINSISKKIEFMQAISLHPIHIRNDMFPFNYRNSIFTPEPFIIEYPMDSFGKFHTAELFFVDKEREEMMVKFDLYNDTLQVDIKETNSLTIKKFIKTKIDKNEYYKKGWLNPTSAVSITNRLILQNKSYSIYNHLNEKIASNVIFNEEGEILNWKTFQWFGINAYHSTKYLSHDRINLGITNDSGKKSSEGHIAIKHKENWTLYEEIIPKFDRIELPKKGKMKYQFKLEK